ncbi:centrosomal protein of 104 kDa isoform X2 [Cynoglossus semilaevis]|uniref:centrosomal protein of 104 kDa isoform X2 n=1 Tax=Cynoglossus semilaevis TaxID=244447 RepID=UPI000D630B0F|nr:centrosomal protein of 104 kDa isoform X2 [Cynoglossus semilaevis]
MPKKIGFVVVKSSSHEDNFSAQELMVHAPTANGWRSSRLCSYPQHITIQLLDRCRVRKLQLLAHQYLIPTKVEFHIGDILPETSTPVLPGQLRRLGYVSLSDNEKTGYKARELKSVHVDAIGMYLKITFHKNHLNGYNQHHQVALVAINVLADFLDGNAFHTIPSREQLIEHYLKSTQLDVALDTTSMGKSDSISPFDDLAFEMYQDPEVAHIIRLMDQKKQDMVRQEKYEQAKNLKQAIADLQKVGERLAQYDIEKRCAIEKEDYDLAKKKKELMENYRRSVYKQLEVHNLLDISLVTRARELSPPPGPPSTLPSPGYCSVPAQLLVSTDTVRTGKKKNTPQDQQSATEAVLPKLSSQPENLCIPAVQADTMTDSTSRTYDERPLPALHRKDRKTAELLQSPVFQKIPQLCTFGSPPLAEVSVEPEQLTKKAQIEAGLPIDVYGESLVAGAYSKTWSYREDALLDLHKRLQEVSPTTTPKEELRNMMRAAVFLVKKGLQDKISSVFQAALKLLRLMLTDLIPGLGLARSELIYCLEQTWPNLLTRTGDSASRLRDMAVIFIQEIAVLKDIRALQIIPCELVKPFKSSFPSRLARSQVELLEGLLVELGTDNSGFTLDNVMMFCSAALQHSAAPVRVPAVRIIMSMYQQDGDALLNYLPPSDSALRKTFLYKTLFDGFAKMDGKLMETQTLKKGSGVQQEIPSPQEQLAAPTLFTESVKQGTKAPVTKKGAPNVEKETHKSIKTTPQKITDTEDVSESISSQDNLCIFCGKKDKLFTEDGLDLHYWKHCPMLQHCNECRQIVEIVSLTEHLLGDCESSSKFSQCQRCSEAVVTKDLSQHLQSPSCNPPVSSKCSNHCPLCHDNFHPGEEVQLKNTCKKRSCYSLEGSPHGQRRL